MPAIHLARLKIQCAQLAERFSGPKEFVRDLHDLLDFYAERTYRPGQAGEPAPLLKSYNVPQPVLRQVIKELTPGAMGDRLAALALCDALWAEPTYEFRLLAIALLGQISPIPPEDILRRVETWAAPSTEVRLISAMFQEGLASLRDELPEQYFQLIEEWLHSTDAFAQYLGLQALHAMLQNRSFDNLPVLFRMITPLVRSAPSALRPDLLNVIQQLARHSPKETAFFLRQNLEIKTDNPGTAWLARQSLSTFPIEVQSGLRHALRAYRNAGE